MVNVGYEYTRAISREPGSLYELLQGIKKLSDTDVSLECFTIKLIIDN